MTTRGERLLQRLYERDVANPGQRTRFSSGIQFTPESHQDAEKRAIAASLAVRSRIEKDSENAEFIRRWKEEQKMNQTKESIWSELQQRANQTAPKDGMESTEQGIARLLNTPEGSKLYEAWKAAPWAADNPANPFQKPSATIRKSELEPSAIRQAVTKAEAERNEGLRKMGAEAVARTR
jgi:hypothetical protein